MKALHSEQRRRHEADNQNGYLSLNISQNNQSLIYNSNSSNNHD